MFPISNNVMVLTTSYVTEGGRPICRVIRRIDDDGDEFWQFLSEDRDSRSEVIRMVLLGTIIEIDKTVMAVSQLGINEIAFRAGREGRWNVTTA